MLNIELILNDLYWSDGFIKLVISSILIKLRKYLNYMNKIKLLLADPRHKTVGSHSYFVPIGIGYIGSHLINQFKNQIEVKLSVDAQETFDILENWKPDIIGV